MFEIRRDKIMNFLKDQSSMTVRELADHLEVSEMTIRRDLSKMESDGVVKRYFGGVSCTTGTIAAQSIPLRAANMPAAKKKMAALANELVHDGDSVILDSGTTIYELAKLLGKKQLFIATSSLLVAENANSDTARIHLSGGKLDPKFKTLSGYYAENFYETINCDYAFVGAGGVSLKCGITEFTEDAAALKRKMLSRARVGILMVDSTKIDTIQTFRAVALEDIDIIITDCIPPSEYMDFFENKGIKILIAEDEGQIVY